MEGEREALRERERAERREGEQREGGTGRRTPAAQVKARAGRWMEGAEGRAE